MDVRFGSALAMLSLSFAALAADASSVEAQSRALGRASGAVLGVEAQAIDDARSAATLGSQRKGSGVVIGADGLVLTIGYLVLEAEQVDLVTDDEGHIPARVIGYDVATGFGLLQALVPLPMAPVPLGDPAALRAGEQLMIVSGGGEGEIGPAKLVARRPFSGYWEYHIDGALFTAPARRDHSGAGLFNLRGELVGIGSLVVGAAGDAGGGDGAGGAAGGRSAGNMFVPVDLLKPILADLRARGRSAASDRAWLGVNCVEVGGEIRIVRIADDSPADVAGLQPGDRIVRIDGTAVAGLEQLWKRLWSGSGAEREVTLDIERDAKPQTVRLQSVDRAKTLRHPRGV